jgi:hypothetical protein
VLDTMWMYLLYIGLFLVIMRVGVAVLRAFARPVPEPPPPGELRKVNLRYRCSVCGAELKMTHAAEEEPEPPRHCMEQMELVAPRIE